MAEITNVDENIEQARKEINHAELKLKLLELLIKIEEVHSVYTDIVNKKKATAETST